LITILSTIITAMFIMYYLVLMKLLREFQGLKMKIREDFDEIQEGITRVLKLRRSLEDVVSVAGELLTLKSQGGLDLSYLKLAILDSEGMIDEVNGVISDLTRSVDEVASIRKVLLGLSDRITTGDARLLQSVLKTYSSRIKLDKRSEAFHRHIKGVISYLDQKVEEELYDSIAALPQSSP